MERLGILTSHPSFRNFWIARSLSFLGDAIAAISLVLYIYANGGSGNTVALLLLAQVLPQLFGPFAGAISDRLDHRRMMIGTDLGRGLLFGVIAVTLPVFPVLLVLVLGTGILSTLFLPAGRSTVPALVKRSNLTAANALLGVSLNFSLAAGPAVGGALYSLVGIRAALLFNAVTFLLSAYFVARLPAPQSESGENVSSGSLLAETRQGIVFLARHAVARAVAISLFLVVMFAAMDNVALVFLARDELRASGLGFGVIASAYGAGMVLAPLLILRLPRYSAISTLFAGIALTGVGGLLTGIAPIALVATSAQFVGGSGNGLENVATDTIIQSTVPSSMLGRVFGTAYGGVYIASGIAYAAGGLLLDLTSPRLTFILAGSGVLVSLLITWLLVPATTRADVDTHADSV